MIEADHAPARRLSEADIRMADIGDGEAINRMAYAKPARRLSEADIRMADIGDGEAINRMSDEARRAAGPAARRVVRRRGRTRDRRPHLWRSSPDTASLAKMFSIK
ncbi:hypothetical protein M446_0727 [Methylobacterium sp. 4-46]|uniref:hypothetical protein n=1 Tax=unclassified Methylobacterium TaxID=2615210 RepID=UPI000152C242|nr:MULTISPECIES: hypothetical protein [Methylobacterium]ACA15286.1 hypothetical protein M446_0727 [Methylobacterium sp. 4-46]WFT81014.1 hypothetical protein QA634_03675 [Methylobacterium nodulans]